MTDAPFEPGGSPPEPTDAESRGSATPTTARRGHGRALLAGAVVVAVVGVLVLAVRPVTAPAPSDSPPPSAQASGPVPTAPAASGYIAARDEILQRVAWANDGQEPFATGLRDLIDFADEASNDDPRPRQPLNISGRAGRSWMTRPRHTVWRWPTWRPTTSATPKRAPGT